MPGLGQGHQDTKYRPTCHRSRSGPARRTAGGYEIYPLT
jgi:hypothetical protein